MYGKFKGLSEKTIEHCTNIRRHPSEVHISSDSGISAASELKSMPQELPDEIELNEDEVEQEESSEGEQAVSDEEQPTELEGGAKT